MGATKTWASGLLAATLSACAPMTGTASFPLISDVDVKNKLVSTGQTVDESECTNIVLLLAIFGTAQPNHQNLVRRILDENQADGLVNTEIKTGGFFFPILFSQNCVYVKGELAKFKAES